MMRYLNGYVLYPLLEKTIKRDILSKHEELRKFEKFSFDKQRTIQKKEMVKTLEFCQSNIPYYKELFKESGFDYKKCELDLRYLSELPILTKDIVRERTKDLKINNPKHKRKTGGSTGQSVQFLYDDIGLDWTAAINIMAYEMAGCTFHKTNCHISSDIGVGPKTFKSKCIDFIKLSSQNRKRLMINSFSDKDLEETFKFFNKYKPYLLQGHPSTSYAIAEYIKRSGKKKVKYCDIFEPSGEMLNDKMVQSIEENLMCKVVNRYGNAEFGVMAHSKLEDSYRKLKVFDRCFFVEECVESNIIVSNFTNDGMPLLRYDTGDCATVKIESDGTYIYDIQGRIHDNVDICGENFATHYIMDYLDHRIKNVREFQIVIKDDTFPILKIVPEKDDDKKRIFDQLKSKWPEGIYFEFIKFQDLETVGWRQKFRHVIDKRSA
jgi:phenylacetate-CoA ligase